MILIEIFQQDHSRASFIFSMVVSITAAVPLICAFINDYFIRSSYLLLVGTTIMLSQYFLVINGIENISLATYVLFCCLNSIAVPILRSTIPNYISSNTQKTNTQKRKSISYIVATTNLGILFGIFLSTRILSNVSQKLFILMMILMTINFLVVILLVIIERKFMTTKILQDNIKLRINELFNLSKLTANFRSVKSSIIYILPSVIYFILYEQKYSTLLIQAKRMNCESSFMVIRYSDVLLVASITAVLAIFIWNKYIYDKLLSKKIITNPISAMSFGTNFAIVSAFLSLTLQIFLDFGESVHIYWGILNYIILTIGDAIVYTAGISFAYNEISKNNRAISGSIWHLIVCCSAVILGVLSKIFIQERCDYKIFLVSFILILVSKRLFFKNAQHYDLNKKIPQC